MTIAMLVILIVSVIFKLLPPTKINYFYGYRTPRSMKDPLSWKVANAYSAALMVWLFLALTILSAIFDLLEIYDVNVFLGAMALAFLAIFILTERKLKQFQNADGV